MSDRVFVGIFRTVLGKVMEKYRPEAVVLQCGADSLSGDRLGCFNLSLEGPSKPFSPRPILPNFSVLARACLWCLGARTWRVNLPSRVKSIPIHV